MKSVKSILSAIIITMGLSTAAFAGDPQTNTKDGATAVGVRAATPAKTTNYYVTSYNTSNGLYSISTDGNDGDCDESPNYACVFTSTNDALGSTIAKSIVDGGSANGITVTATRSALPNQ